MEVHRPSSDRLLKRPQVEFLTGMSRAAIYQKMATGQFPRPVRIGRRSVAWPLSVIDEWIEARKAEAGIDAGT